MRGWRNSWNRPHVANSGGRGQIGLVRTHGLSSWLIRVVTRSKVNHTVTDTGTCLISAEYPHVRTRPYGHFTNIIWSQFAFQNNQADKIVEFAEAQIGKPYGTLDDIAIGVALITRDHTPHRLMRWLSNNGEWICSALCDAALRHAGIHIFTDGRPVGTVFPGSYTSFYNDAGWMPKHVLFSKRTPQ